MSFDSLCLYSEHQANSGETATGKDCFQASKAGNQGTGPGNYIPSDECLLGAARMVQLSLCSHRISGTGSGQDHRTIKNLRRVYLFYPSFRLVKEGGFTHE